MNKRIIILPVLMLSLSSVYPYVYAEELVDNNVEVVSIEEQNEGILIQNNEILMDSSYDDLSFTLNEDHSILQIVDKNIQDTIKVHQSNLEIELINSQLQGSIFLEDSTLSIKMDSQSTLTLEDDLYLSSLEDELEDYQNIILNGHHLYIDGEELVLDIEELSLDKEEIIVEIEELTIEEEEDSEAKEEIVISDNQEEKEIEQKKSKSTHSSNKTQTTTQTKQKNNTYSRTKKEKTTESSDKSLKEEKTKKEKNSESLENSKDSSIKDKKIESGKNIEVEEEDQLGFFEKIFLKIKTFFHTLFQ